MATRQELVDAGLGYLWDGAYGGSSIADAIIAEQLAGRGSQRNVAPPPPAVYQSRPIGAVEQYDPGVWRDTATSAYFTSANPYDANGWIALGFDAAAALRDPRRLYPPAGGYTPPASPSPIPAPTPAPPVPPAAPRIGPVAPPAPTGGSSAVPLADLIAQIAATYGATSNWNALRPDGAPGVYASDPLLQQLGAIVGTSSNWQAYRPSATVVVHVPTPSPTPSPSPSPTLNIPTVVHLGPTGPDINIPTVRLRPDVIDGGVGFLGGPIVGTVVLAIGLIATLFHKSGDTDAVQRDVRTLRDQVAALAVALANYASQGATVDGKSTSLLKTIVGGILGPLINMIAGVVSKISGTLKKWLQPLIDHLATITALVKQIYTKWLKPILSIIDTVRQLLKLLELFHIEWAQKADDALGALERKLTAPILFALDKLNEVSNWINRVVTLDGLLQRTMLLQSTYKHMGAILAQGWALQLRGVKVAASAQQSKPGNAYSDPHDNAKALESLYRGEGGRLPGYSRELVSVWRVAAGLDDFKDQAA